MTQKAIDLKRLQALTKRGRQRSEERASKARLSEDQKYDAEAKKLSDAIISGLPEDIEEEAKRGSDSLTVYLPFGYQLHDRVKRNISSWCFANRLSVRSEDVHPSDDCTENVLVIFWPS